jgi:DNA-binding response OmpR family regulator
MAPSILLVDDDPDNCEVLTDFLRHHGFSVDCAYSGAQAIEKVNADSFSAVILDLGLPDGDGLAVLRLLKQTAPATPIIILTGSHQSATALRNGAFAFLLKPWNREELLDALARATSVSSR